MARPDMRVRRLPREQIGPDICARGLDVIKGAKDKTRSRTKVAQHVGVRRRVAGGACAGKFRFGLFSVTLLETLRQKLSCAFCKSGVLEMERSMFFAGNPDDHRAPGRGLGRFDPDRIGC